MQDCFRLHPEVYGDELADDDEEAPAGEAAPEQSRATTQTAPSEGDGSSASATPQIDAKPDANPAASDEQPAAVTTAKTPEARTPTSEAS